MPEIKEVNIVLRDGYNVSVEKTKVLWECPTCGGPMGEPKGMNFFEDGESYHCDTWNNPCGHVAPYRLLKLLKENGEFITWEQILLNRKQRIVEERKREQAEWLQRDQSD